jgi:transposase-like protein
MIQNRKKYVKEFKQKAVELSYARAYAKEIADELGIDKRALTNT